MEPKKQVKRPNKTQETPVSKPTMNVQASKDKLDIARKNVEIAFRAWHEILMTKKLLTNKNERELNEERLASDALSKAAQELDVANPGEGAIILAGIAVREELKLRDRINEIDYNTCLLRKDFNELKEKLDGVKPV